ncbi:hypothetical protein AKJ65_04215 [candidate division MSBL1 archaeon SCGC-AAA259E19]|uniref:Uncharacterized protein n=1 Tax=candidate division MSBL1 archaeon SCGC-AAA259E19 TaxID=1698264 RepID=A0A133UJX9_9EURY|nr:hypothetical protein AKJ65_04215 [candidate division MSBL1 archaeon SCGC-AAA259E19]
MTICEKCIKRSTEGVNLSENFERIIRCLKEDRAKWHLQYTRRMIHFPFALIKEDEGECCVIFLRESPVTQIARFTRKLEESGVDYKIDLVHGIDEDGKIVFPPDFDSFDEFKRETNGFKDMRKKKRRGKQENPMFG